MDAARTIEKRFTYADYCTWPDDERWELIDGVAYAMSAPAEVHQRLLGELFGQLWTFFKGKTCQVYVAPFDVRLNAESGDNSVVQPDILVVCDKKKLENGKAVIGVPDFVIEILSPSNPQHDSVTKFNLYQEAGVREYWIVDPENKTVFAHTLHGNRYFTRAYHNKGTVPVEIFEGCEINLSDVFG